MRSLTLLTVFVPVLVCLGLIKFIHHVLTDPLRRIPGPRLNRYTIIPLKVQTMRGRRVHYIHELHSKYGSTVRISPTEVAISDLASTREIHRIGSGYLKSEWYAKFTEESEDSLGIFAMINPKQHAVRRRLFSAAFSQTALLQWDEVLQSRTTLVIQKIREQAMSRNGANIFSWFTFMATDVIAELGFGESLHSLEHGKKSSFSEDLEKVMMFSGLRAELGFVATILSRLPIPSIQLWLGSNKRIEAYGVAAIATNKSLAARGETKDTLFTKMLRESDEKTGRLSDADIQREASNLIIAGSDTTAVTLTYLVWAVLKNPEVKSKLVTELSGIGNNPNSKDTNSLPYLGAIIKETLRLYGAAPGSLPRAVPRGGRTIDSYFIPEGTTVSTQAHTLHRDPRIFPSPLQFQPERWLEPTQEMKDAWLPFGGGSRVCIGLHLAQSELSLAAAKFFKECSTTKVRTRDEDMELENYFLVAPKGHKCEIVLENM
ncbi:sterigmatocystin biosynthesis P450 monooxygenase [Leptodontidium sp. MPI-SDFR-AT-0119]|nr:sterigmatocystin biosynthesis P450 monooxygenase [Leptodontidium sp. MPI-SDFR-AT-0119]